ncbi:AAA family ATPase [Oceanobacillus kimchii]|uniref:Protein CR006 P-loop domain-containing protein n=1 Tax=Oceanobacillus kimchii TaxID=746691 RepID=A0ABQ5TCV0_9BACI|nr:AAA family ATPase [Oceanobacillus kimchii]GLO64433.1 hypothetical protein MACH08_02170 [Oceanobacillus kimchii]
MEDLIKELEDWLSQRTLWIQHATNKILLGNVTEKEIEELMTICKEEIKDEGNMTIEPLKIQKGQISSGEENINLTVGSLSDIKGVNALTPRNPLKIGENLNIIYGQNGSGKSSYVRLFKHFCDSKNIRPLYGNVYEEKTEQSCKIKYNINGENREINWSPDKSSIEDLTHIEIYDSDSAYTYINEENEVTYEPAILRLMSKLIELCNKVSLKISEEIEKNVSILPSIPEKYKKTESSIWLENLSHNVSREEVDAISVWDNDLQDELNVLVNRLAETNPIEKAKVLRKNIKSIDKLVGIINSLFDELSDEKCTLVINAKQNADLKRKVAEEDAKKVFSNAPINTIDNESWRLLWEQARKFSANFVYIDEKFPKVDEDALCVLCQQPLNNDARKRLTSFEEYVKGNLERDAKDAEDQLTKLINELPNIPDIDSFNLMLDSSGIYDDEIRGNITSIIEDMRTRKNHLLNFKSIKDLKILPNYGFVNLLKEEISSLEKQAQSFEEDAKGENRAKIQNQIISLEAKKWLNEQRENIVEEIQRLNYIYVLNEAKKLTRTQVLSTKKSALSEELITEAYVKRFEQELKLLGASHIKIELVKTRTQRGQVLHEIKLSNPRRNVKTIEILSEGEQRIVSFAAFLADIEGKQVNAPLIFDDPISSLDQEYEEAIVARLVEMSRTKQLIVFTHRISLLTLLEEAAKTLEINTNIVCVRREFWGTGEPGDTPLFSKKPDSALNVIYNERLPKAKKVLEDIGREEYELIAKGICSDFRIILERTIETHLLSDIVRRFRRSIQTMGRINNLYKIEQADCELFDTIMTKYSRYEHSQSTEAPVSLPDPQELKEDIGRVMSWTKEFKKR